MSCCSLADVSRRAGPLIALAIALVAALALVPAPASAKVVGGWQPDVDAARTYAHHRQGEVSFAVRTDRRSWGWRRFRSVRSASVVKAMLLVAYLNDPRVRDRRLRAADRRLLDPMIERSDNDAASAVMAYVGAARLSAVARAAGMRKFAVGAYSWGGSQIDAADQTRFFLHIDARIPRRHRGTAMWLLRSVVAWQRWGIGRLQLPGWRLYFKGGWGSGSGAVDHQVALLRRGDERIAVAVMTTGNPDHEYAAKTLRGVFARLLAALPTYSR